MNKLILGLLASVAVATAAAGQTSTPTDPAKVIAANSYAIQYSGGAMSGPGADMLRKATTDSQFVLLGEDHYDREIPQFAATLYRMLHDERGFHHLVVEQDRVAMEEAARPGQRGDAAKIAKVAARYPTLFEFASDQDLQLLADVGRAETNPEPLWGLEQTTSAARYLDELLTLAPNAQVKAEVAAMLADAHAKEPEATFRPWFMVDTATLARAQALQTHFAAKPGSRADFLLSGLVKSAEIYSYNTRSEAGEPVGLYNNTVREAWFKDTFMRDYRRAVARGEATPKAMFKFGDWHLYHGMGPTGAYTIGNFAHEFAISNGMHAVGIQLIALRKDMPYADVPASMRAFTPATPPTEPTLIDLRPMRPIGKAMRDKVPVEDQWLSRALVNGYDFILIIPGSHRATMDLTHLKVPFEPGS